MIRTLGWVIVLIVLFVVAANHLPNRQITRCTATVTAADGTTQQVPCK